MLRQSLSGAARSIFPALAADRARRHEAAYRAQQGITSLVQRLDPVVQAGPFIGMRYPPERLVEVDAAGAKLLGIYERELQSIFEWAIRKRAPFTDIGCADGYFAVGMALQGCATVAYDISRSARGLCMEVARLNEADVEIRSAFDQPPTSGLLLCDIEGAERDLFDRPLAAALAPVRVLVEVHEDQRPGTSAKLRSVFADTHHAHTISHSPTQPDEVPQLADWSDDEIRKLVAEHRPPLMHWLDLAPRTAAT